MTDPRWISKPAVLLTHAEQVTRHGGPAGLASAEGSLAEIGLADFIYPRLSPGAS